MKHPVTRLDYCQYLLVSQINYTLTNFADHSDAFSHDEVNRYLARNKLTPRLIWDNVQRKLVCTTAGAGTNFVPCSIQSHLVYKQRKKRRELTQKIASRVLRGSGNVL